MYAKRPPYRSEAWRKAVASLPCVICGSPDVQAAHRNEGKSMAMKTDDCWTAALCVAHHEWIDRGNRTREESRREMDRAILLTLRELCAAGLVGPK